MDYFFCRSIFEFLKLTSVLRYLKHVTRICNGVFSHCVISTFTQKMIQVLLPHPTIISKNVFPWKKWIKKIEGPTITSHLHFCPVMFSSGIFPYEVTSCTNLCNSSLVIFGFTLLQTHTLMHLLEQLTEFYKDLCVCQWNLCTDYEILLWNSYRQS